MARSCLPKASMYLACWRRSRAGLLMGNLGVLVEDKERIALSSQGREFVIAFWEFAAFIANSLVFLLIGLRLARIAFRQC